MCCGVTQGTSQVLRLSTGFPYNVLSLSTKPEEPWCTPFSTNSMPHVIQRAPATSEHTPPQSTRQLSLSQVPQHLSTQSTSLYWLPQSTRQFRLLNTSTGKTPRFTHCLSVLAISGSSVAAVCSAPQFLAHENTTTKDAWQLSKQHLANALW
jgi:hypothetical protein